MTSPYINTKTTCSKPSNKKKNTSLPFCLLLRAKDKSKNSYAASHGALVTTRYCDYLVYSHVSLERLPKDTHIIYRMSAVGLP